jgi:hypothetical protein
MYKWAPISQFLKGLARIIRDLLIDEFDLASRSLSEEYISLNHRQTILSGEAPAAQK